MFLLIPLDSINSEAVRWRIVSCRESNDSFVYAVRSTHIYCRPSCPSRLARRSNIEFYDNPLLAEAAGYRACKRCKPQLPSKEEAHHPQRRTAEKACETISNAVLAGRPLSLQQLAADMNLSPAYLHRSFKKIIGLTPLQYTKLIQRRQQETAKAHTQVEGKDDTGTGIAPCEDGSLLPYEIEFNVINESECIDWSLIDWEAFDAYI